MLALEFDGSDSEGPLGLPVFTGLANNGTTNYAEQYTATDVSVSGGRLNVVNVDGGDLYRGINTQRNAFQTGVDLSGSSGVYRLSTQVIAPIGGFSSFESLGLMIGSGDQDNYSKVVVSRRGVQHLTEIERVAASALNTQRRDLSVRTADAVDLWLQIDTTGVQPTATAGYREINGGVAGADIPLGAVHALPLSWVDGSDGKALAVGVVATSYLGSPYTAQWEYLRLELEGTAGSANRAPVAVGDSLTAEIGETVTVLDGGLLSVLANDTDADGDELTAVLESGPLHGSVTLDLEGTFVYVHDGSAGTVDSFSYRAEDTSGESSAEVTVSITVNDPGIPNWQSFASVDGSTLVDRHETGSVVVDGQLYVIGGRGNRPMQSFDPQTGTWTDLGTPPIQLHHVQPVHVDGRIYLIAGMTGNFPAEPSVADIHYYLSLIHI